LALVFLTTVVTATVGVYVLPPIYRASATVVVEPMKARSLRAETYVGQVDTIEAINTEMAIVLSRTVMQNAVDKLKLPERTERTSPLSRAMRGLRGTLTTLGLLPEVERREQWIGALLRDVQTRPTVNSSIFTVSYSHEDPRLATEIVNAVTDEYLGHHFAIYAEKGVADLYRAQMDLSKERLDAARADLERYKVEKAVAAAGPRKERLAIEMTNLRERVSRFNLEMKELVARAEAGDPRLALLKAKIRTTEEDLGRVRSQLAALESAEAKAGEVEVTVKAQEKNYLAYREQFERASISSAGSKNVVNVRVVDYASVPARPRFSRLFLIAVAAALGAVLAVGLAMVREHFDHRVVTPAMAERALGVPVLGSIERLRNRARPGTAGATGGEAGAERGSQSRGS